MNVAEILREHADRRPHDAALIDRRHGRSRTVAYAQLEQAAGQMAALLHAHGLRPGDAVLVFHKMSAELYIAIAGLLRSGLTAMFLDPSAGRRYIDACCALHRPRAMIAGSTMHCLRLVSAEMRRIPLKFSIGCRVPGAIRAESARRLPYRREVFAAEADSPALLSFTTGITGEPKAAMRTHGFLLAQHAAIEQNLDLQPGDVELVTLPIFVLANLASRVTSILPAGDIRRPDAIAPEPIVRQILTHRPTRAAAPPSFLERLADYCQARQLTLPNLRRILTGGGPVAPRLFTRLHDMAPNADVVVVYGSTEAEPISTMAASRMDAADRAAMFGGRGLLVGAPAPHLDLRIMRDQWGVAIGPLADDDFHQLCQPPRQMGEIVVSGAHVLSTYLYDRGNDQNKFTVDGVPWHRTGDAGYLDDCGRLWLVGRCAARVDDQRGALYPLGVEHAALQHEYIRRAALISHRGQRVLAVELSRRANNPDLASLLKSLSFAGIDAIHILRRMPMDRRHNSKVDYRSLHAALEARR
jgi:acyl-CoA synthetase (AMP-forming)/AMP-acid ligase II